MTGALWMAGFLAICGSPPFGLFVSEIVMLRAMFAGGAMVAAVCMLVFLALIFIGMSVPVVRMVQGPVPPAVHPPAAEPVVSWGPPLVLLTLVLALGLFLPAPVETFLHRVAGAIGG